LYVVSQYELKQSKDPHESLDSSNFFRTAKSGFLENKGIKRCEFEFKFARDYLTEKTKTD
jgi:hypothetical protein